MMLLTCSSCGATNRIPAILKKRLRCGKCQHVFTPMEMTHTRAEPVTAPAYTLAREDDLPAFACNDDAECGWEGSVLDLEDRRCPECGSKVHSLHDIFG